MCRPVWVNQTDYFLQMLHGLGFRPVFSFQGLGFRALSVGFQAFRIQDLGPRVLNTNWWQQIVLVVIFDDQAHKGGNKSYFFPSLTTKHKLVATNRTSSHL